MKSLGELINAALSEADSSLKLASARDAEIPDPGDFLAAELALPKVAAEEPPKKSCETCKKDPCVCEKSEKKSSRNDVLDLASYGLKLAQALEMGAHVVAKMAAEGMNPLKAPGPQVMESGFIGAQTISPKPQGSVTEKITGPSTDHSDLSTTKNDHTGNLDGQQPPNNTGKTAGWVRSKEASLRLLRAKQAQAETLMRMGQTKAAEKILAEVEKQAQDPSSPQPEGMPAHSDSFKITTEPGESTFVPDNAGLISMTKAQAKDRSVRTVSDHFIGEPKKDNAVAAHTLRTDGQKVSALIVEAVHGAPFRKW